MSTALYRRYRPDRFEDVIGQDHVTVPLRTALSKDRVNHAYLFSGPRGCGKTTSARILARCLNCAQGPTPTPCGECDSCRDLATGGPGSLDVLEIDAASHGGVDDARGLRERATFAPVRDRYKILIIDEAHMVTAAGFNALLKIVEEPPEHLKFIFATTEPDKVIGTIRSRTHHYPFRLVPPEPLIAHLEQLCQEEGIRVQPGVLPLVVRAGTGSVRDTLSVLDQLIGGAQQGQVSYELAVSLLGFTPEALLDDVIDAVAAEDTPTVFRVADRVVQSGQDPRRFVEDLLDRFRDLVIARALPDEAGAILHGMPEDQVRRLAAQAAQLSRSELSRLADVTNVALTDMVGATSPRLHLELLMARLMLPATDDSHRGLAARLEALERRVGAGAPLTDDDGVPADTVSTRGTADGAAGLSGAALARAAARRAETAAAPAPETADTPAPAAPTEDTRPAPVAPDTPRPAETGGGTDGEAPARRPAPEAAPTSSAGPRTAEEPPAQRAAAPAGPAAAPIPAAAAPSQVEKVRRAWPDILGAIEDSSRLVWMLVKDNASVAGYDGDLLTVAFTQDGPRRTLLARQGDQVLAEAVHRVLGIRPELDLILGGDGPQDGDRPGGGPSRPDRPAPPQGPQPGRGSAPESAEEPTTPRPSAERAAPAPAAPERRTPAEPSPPSAPAGRTSAPEVPVATSWPSPAPTPSGATPPPPARTEQPTGRPAPAPPSGGPAPTAARPAAPAEARSATRPGPADTTPPAAPAPQGWGRADEEPPAWEDAPPPPEDPWDDLPEFDPDADMEDSPGPEGWTPDQDGAEGSDRAAPAAPALDVPTPQDWGAPAGQGAAAPSSPAPDQPAEAPPAPSDADVRRAYDPGPLVREEEHTIPVFAKPEAELRAEFAARFGGTRPAGFDADRAAEQADDSPSGDDDADPDRPGAAVRAALAGEPDRYGQDAAEHAAEEEAGVREDPQAAASGTEDPVSASPARPTADDTPDPGVPAEHHDDAEGDSGGGRTGAPTRAPGEGRGSGHPDSWFGALMERLEAGGPLDPPVNAGRPGPDSAAGPGGRPSAAALGGPDGSDPAPPTGTVDVDPRAAAIRAAREAARGGGARLDGDAPAGPAAASAPSVDWSDEVASEDDVSLEESGLVGRPVVERLLGARLLEERPHEGGF
ncbi:DNA polymerase III subunit gamma and tau [Micrococcus lacusdianchii]|uniref:DNA polymerase III subunit gamma and tau n=2 Tax=Micrococcus TaxID=1269 RepID=UPI002FF9BB6F